MPYLFVRKWDCCVTVRVLCYCSLPLAFMCICMNSTFSGLSVSVEASSTAMGEGTTMTLSVGYSGILHPLSAVGVTVTTLSGSATG